VDTPELNLVLKTNVLRIPLPDEAQL
jgi:hypothetical protein